jgi:lysophospholipase L1-like esterase
MDKAEHFGEGKREFRSLACSGYTSTQIKENQVPLLTDKSQQLITLSAGGNDANVSHIIDACVYQITPGVALSDKCDEALEETADIINRNLGDSLDDLYNALKPKLADGAKIFHTGYARYWNADTDQCDDVTRSVVTVSAFF